MRQEDGVVRRRLAVRVRNGLVVADVEKLGALFQDVGQHDEDVVVTAVLFARLHRREHLVLTAQELVRVEARDLPDTELVVRDEELLEVGEDQLFHRLAEVRAGKDGVPYFLERDLGNAGHALRDDLVMRCTGGRFEHDRVRNDGADQQPRDLLRRHDALLLVHFGDDGGGGAQHFVAEEDGSGGLDVREAVVVDDAEHFRFAEPGHRLRQFVVVHEHDAFALRADHVVPAHGPDDFVVLIEDGVRSVPGVQEHILHVVEVVVEVEDLEVLGGADAVDRQRQVDHPRGPVGRQRRCNDQRLGRVITAFFRDIRLADDHSLHADVQRMADHVRLLAADDNAVRVIEQHAFMGGGDGDDHIAREFLGNARGLVDDLPLENREQVVDGDVVHMGRIHVFHAVVRDVSAGHHAIEGAVVLHDGDDGRRAVTSLHGLPGVGDGHAPRHGGRGVEDEVPHLGAHVRDEHRRFRVELVEHTLGLIGDVAEAGRHIFPVAERVAQRRIGDSRHNGVGVRVLVTGDIDRVFYNRVHTGSHFLTRSLPLQGFSFAPLFYPTWAIYKREN